MAEHDILRAFAEGRMHHLNRGICPDQIAGHQSRDPDCPVCQALSAPLPAGAQQAVALAALDALGDDAAVHIWPTDLEKCSRSECIVKVHSVRMGSPDGHTVPLFSRDQVAAALAAPAAPSDPSGQKQRSDAWLAVSDAIKEHWAGTAAVGAEDAVRLIAMLAAEAKAYRAAGRPAAGAQQAVATRIAGEAAAFRWLIANRITEDKNGCLQLHYETSRQGKDHPDKQWVANDIAWEAGVDLAALTASAAAQRADCARCKGVGAVGDHNGERAVEISCDHCGGTGRAPSATPAPEAAPSAKEGEAPMLLATAPEHIWLDLGEDFDGDPATTAFHELSDQTWSEDNASGKGIKYVRVGIEGLTPVGGDRG